MSQVTERLQGIGSWSLKMKEDTPRSIVEGIDWWHHILVTETRATGASLDDATMLPISRYTGVVTDKADGVISGKGMAWWLGDSQGRSVEMFTARRKYIGVDVADIMDKSTAVVGLLRDAAGNQLAIEAGSISGDATTYTFKVKHSSQRDAINALAEVADMEWRVNPDGTIDFDTEANLFVTTPTTLFARDAGGTDLHIEGLRARATGVGRSSRDLIKTIAIVDEKGKVTTYANTDPEFTTLAPKDIHGNDTGPVYLHGENPLKSNAATLGAKLQAEVRLARFRKETTVELEDFDVRGTFRVGDTVFVYDPDNSLTDTAQQTTYRGAIISPIAQRVFTHSWAITRGMGVYARDYAGGYTDLSEWVEFDAPKESVIVGAQERSLTADGDFAKGSQVRQITAEKNTFYLEGEPNAEFGEFGLATDVSEDALPRVYFIDTGGNDTPTTSGAYFTVGTFTVDLGTQKLSIIATGQALLDQTASTTGRDVRSRLGISTDGGSSFTDGSPSRQDDLRSDGTTRVSLGPVLGLEGVTPTGAVHVRLQVRIDNTEVDVANSQMVISIVGDI